jgi:hypothetical protein
MIRLKLLEFVESPIISKVLIVHCFYEKTKLLLVELGYI